MVASAAKRKRTCRCVGRVQIRSPRRKCCHANGSNSNSNSNDNGNGNNANDDDDNSGNDKSERVWNGRYE